MSASMKFLDIVKVKGLQNYILVNKEGKIMFHNYESANEVLPYVFDIGLNCLALKQTAGFSSFRYFILNRRNGEKFIVFSVGQYFLGVSSAKGIDSDVLINEIALFLKNIIEPS